MRILRTFVTQAVAPPTDGESAARAKVQAVVEALKAAPENPREWFGVSFAKLEGVKANVHLTPDGVRATALPVHARELTVEALQKIERYLYSVDLTPPRSIAPDAGYVKALTRAFANEGVELVATATAGGKLTGVLHIEEMRIALVAKEHDAVERVGKKHTQKKVKHRGPRQARGRKTTTVKANRTKSARRIAVRRLRPPYPVLRPRYSDPWKGGTSTYGLPTNDPADRFGDMDVQFFVRWLDDGSAQVDIFPYPDGRKVKPGQRFKLKRPVGRHGRVVGVTGEFSQFGLTILTYHDDYFDTSLRRPVILRPEKAPTVGQPKAKSVGARPVSAGRRELESCLSNRPGDAWYDIPVRDPRGRQHSVRLMVEWYSDGSIAVRRGMEIAKVRAGERFNLTTFPRDSNDAKFAGKLGRNGLTITSCVEMTSFPDHNGKLEHPVVLKCPSGWLPPPRQ